MFSIGRNKRQKGNPTFFTVNMLKFPTSQKYQFHLLDKDTEKVVKHSFKNCCNDDSCKRSHFALSVWEDMCLQLNKGKWQVKIALFKVLDLAIGRCFRCCQSYIMIGCGWRNVCRGSRGGRMRVKEVRARKHRRWGRGSCTNEDKEKTRKIKT